MFLNRLNGEEKSAFLKLAHYIARSDNDFSKKEEDLISIYCMEMQIEDSRFVESSFNMEKILEIFQSKRAQKIVLMEILALIYSDGFLHEQEDKILNLMLKKFEISLELSMRYTEWAKAILMLSVEGESLIEL